ncbi:MAG TPA: hypothetical protein PKO06_20765 [Candidatus Ozemobacteraceae bacterium]|nr:hypothetical protein [Candidatus Ozemobacteraceae bacterium]
MKASHQARVELFAVLFSVTLLVSPLNSSLFAQDTAATEPSTDLQNSVSATSPDSSSSASSEMSESDNADMLAQKHPFALENQTKDPFKPLIEKPKPVIVQPDPKPNPTPDPRPQPQPIKPLSLLVQGICGNEGSRWALITYENQVRVVTQDMNVDGTFKVVAIEPDRLIVYSNKHQSRQTFNISK